LVDFNTQRQSALDAQFKAYREAADEVAKVNTTIDPNRFWASKTTGQRVMAGLMIAAGYLGRGQQHNQALDYIQNAVQQDIDAQKSMVDYQLRKGNEAIAAQQTLYGMMRSRFQDDATALAATQAAAFGVVQKKLDAAIAGTQDAARKAAYEQLQAGVEAQQQQALQQLHIHADDSAQKWANLNLQRQNMLLDYASKQQKAAGKDPELFVPGYGYALSKDAVKDVREAVSAHGKTKAILGDLQALRSQYGGEVLPTNAKASMKTLGAKLMGALNKADKFGALDKGTQEILKEMMGGNVTDYTGVDAALRTISTTLDSDLAGELRPRMDPRTYQTPKAKEEALGFRAR